ncbi:MAG: DUF805 domain-containing protein [Pseudoflavonifractor sp.]|nr:DUF805 domain-containing protein [Alloprevotella sp.]MCM1117703.1 DUF805 domain-containing protein [Pseudoflavonifractor sp.]
MYQRQVSFEEAIRRALTDNYCNFSGRASRSEYWWFALGMFILSFIFNILAAVFSFSEALTYVVASISCLVSLALLLPGLGLSVRRLHDIGKSGWWVLIAFIPVVGAILLIVWFCQESQPTANEYGEVPNVA